MVTGYGADFYWTPGGGVEPGETPVDALHREIMEELGLRVTSYVPHSLFEYDNQRVENFLIEVEGDMQVGGEITSADWYWTGSNINPSEGFKNTTLRRLLVENLID